MLVEIAPKRHVVKCACVSRKAAKRKPGNDPAIVFVGLDYLLGPGGKSLARRPTKKEPALTPLLTFRPRAAVWLWLLVIPPAFTFDLTFKPREAVWLWLSASAPAFTFDLIFICPYYL
jgi:hypothetical protein